MGNGPGFVPDEQAPALTEEQARRLHCYICGNDDAYELQELDEPLTAGDNTAIVRVKVAVCRFCGEQVFDLPTRARLQRVYEQLERRDVDGFEPVGLTYRVS